MTLPASVRAAGAALIVLLPAAPVAAGDAIGRALFERAWVPAPSSTRAADGLGPHFDARACAACHPGGDRPSARPTSAAPTVPLPRGMVVRLSRADGSADPIYGRQLQSEAVIGVEPEARIALARGRDGSRPPRAVITRLAHGPLAADTAVSLRLAPALFGLGAIEAVPDAAIRALADPDDRDGDGISGRVSEVIDADGHARIGRWGFKAGRADLAEQTAEAFATDMGLSSRHRPAVGGDCTPAEIDCSAAPAGAPDAAGAHEIGEPVVEAIVAFLADLDRPAVAPAPAAPSRGAAIYAALGCAGCHAPLIGAGRIVHSDLLLHDLGPDLASGAPEGSAGSRDWRTTPLIGLGDRLARRTPLLHDGRAATLAEAVAAHGGEATAARRRWSALDPAARRALAAHLATFREVP